MSEEKPKVALEPAVEEFKRFARAMDLDINEEYMSADDIESLAGHKQIILNAIMRGHLVVNDKGEPVYTPRVSDDRSPITFHQATGAVFMEADSAPVGANIRRLIHMMGALTGEGAKRFAQMKKPDLDVCMAVASLFLG